MKPHQIKKAIKARDQGIENLKRYIKSTEALLNYYKDALKEANKETLK